MNTKQLNDVLVSLLMDSFSLLPLLNVSRKSPFSCFNASVLFCSHSILPCAECFTSSIQNMDCAKAAAQISERVTEAYLMFVVHSQSIYDVTITY